MRDVIVIGPPLCLQVDGQVHTSFSYDTASFSHLSCDAYASDLGRYLEMRVKKCNIEICHKRYLTHLYFYISLGYSQNTDCVTSSETTLR